MEIVHREPDFYIYYFEPTHQANVDQMLVKSPLYTLRLLLMGEICPDRQGVVDS